MGSFKLFLSAVALLVLAIPFAFSQSSDPFPMPLCNGFVIEEVDIHTLQAYMANGNLTSVQLTKCYIDRITQLNPYLQYAHLWCTMLISEPLSKSILMPWTLPLLPMRREPLALFMVLFTEFLSWLRIILVARIRCRQLLVPWRNTLISTRLTNNSLIGSIIPADSNVVALLRKAGAVLLGKANLSEWADARSSSYSEGYSARGGQTRPPYNLTQEPGGSSSGPAVSVAANMVPFALGTETDGSVISPADRNAVVGLKPTVGLTARTGVIPESHRQDSVGVFGKTVKDAAYALDGCFGPDPADNYSMAQIGKTPSSISHNLTVLIIDYSQFVKGKSALQGVKLAVPWQRLWTAPSTQDQLPQLLAAIEALQAAGAIIYNNTNPPFINDTISPDGWSSNYGANASLTEAYLGNIDLYNDFNTYLGNLTYSPCRTLQDIINFNNDNTGSEGGIPGTFPAFASGQDGFLSAQAAMGEVNSTYWDAFNYVTYTSGPMGIDYILNYPVNGTPVQMDGYLVPSDDSGPGFQLAARVGYPIISIPVGTDVYGMPFGICVGGTAWSEAKLVELASGIEDVIQGRTLPTFYERNAKNVPAPYGYQPGEPLPVAADYTRLW